jgi:glycosyltransferase involved in cell wall biosynthesis
MKIAFYVPNTALAKVDFTSPAYGNPGSGAAEYLHVALPFYIADEGFETFIYAQETALMPKNITAVQCDSIRDAAIAAKDNGVDIFVFRPRIHQEDEILQLLDELKLPSIGRAALTPSPQHVRQMAKCEYFKALVAVGSEQYDFLCDSPVAGKLTHIDNGVSVEACQVYSHINKNQNLVTYMGAIVPQKGFHVLARIWPRVLLEHPNAELRVIGSSKIYNENYTVGPLGVADEEYERKYIIPHLCDPNLNILPSVKFLGSLGNEKYLHLTESMVGIANPTGQTETCCVSAVEMSACGTAVVTGAYYALLGTVINNVTGLLGRGDKKLKDNICKLLSNADLAIKLGKNGKDRAEKIHSFKKVAILWQHLCTDIHQNDTLRKPKHQFRNIRYHRKWLRILNVLPSKSIGKIVFWPSVQELENYIILFLRALKIR